MREIKFRAWDKTKKEWLFDFRLHPDGSIMAIQNPFISVGKKYEYSTKEIKNVLLMQYTDLKDKNGKEIYEGDIVKSIWGQFAGGEPMYENRIVNFYQDNNTMWWCLQDRRDYKNYWSGAHNQWRAYEMEVIGNIYENPELIK